jgi:hypothetical protein
MLERIRRLSKHDCFTNPVFVLDNMLLCARCYAIRALRTYGKEAYFQNGSLVMVEYQDLSHLEAAAGCDALVTRAALYKEYLETKNF